MESTQGLCTQEERAISIERMPLGQLLVVSSFDPRVIGKRNM